MSANSTTLPTNRAERRTVTKHNTASAELCQHVTIKHAASALNVDPKTIRRRIADGTLPAFRVGIRRPGTLRDTRPIRIPADALAAILSPVATPTADTRNLRGGK